METTGYSGWEGDRPLMDTKATLGQIGYTISLNNNNIEIIFRTMSLVAQKPYSIALAEIALRGIHSRPSFPFQTT